VEHLVIIIQRENVLRAVNYNNNESYFTSYIKLNWLGLLNLLNEIARYRRRIVRPRTWPSLGQVSY